MKECQAKNEISLSCLLEFSDIRQDKFEDILERVVYAMGIDFKDKDTRIEFDIYVRIKCFLKYYTIPMEDLKKIWLLILNPLNSNSLSKEELLDLFERFSRGRIHNVKILMS